jgi:hypothetical protein
MSREQNILSKASEERISEFSNSKEGQLEENHAEFEGDEDSKESKDLVEVSTLKA